MSNDKGVTEVDVLYCKGVADMGMHCCMNSINVDTPNNKTITNVDTPNMTITKMDTLNKTMPPMHPLQSKLINKPNTHTHHHYQQTHQYTT